MLALMAMLFDPVVNRPVLNMCSGPRAIYAASCSILWTKRLIACQRGK